MWQKSDNKRTSAEATLTDSDDEIETTSKQQTSSYTISSNKSSKIFNAVSLAAESINRKVKNETDFHNNLKHKFDNEEEEQATSNKKLKTDNNKGSFADKMMVNKTS